MTGKLSTYGGEISGLLDVTSVLLFVSTKTK
jgi:hypothetical protein